ncbi:MAG TPA: ribonuclease D [Ktedonobacterales bacterium]|nr:ribonuclease D [Ktedonobacterales bacterium]
MNAQALDDNLYHGDTPPVEPPPARGERVWVERPDELAAAVERLASASVVAVDAEFMQVRPSEPEGHRHQLALLQIAIGQVCYVIDVLRLADLTPLAAVTEDSLILKLFHGIGADTQMLARRGLAAASTCDVEAASRSIFGQRESGLATMLERAFGVHLDKSLQRSDWGRRPLSPAMFAYAARDAEMTLALYDWLKRHYPWAVELHTESGSPASAETARLPVWVEQFVEGGRNLPPEVAVAEAGLADDVAGQVRDCGLALSLLRHPGRRARLMRLISDLGLVQLAPQMLPALAAPAAEERAAAARTLGRLARLGAPDVQDAPERLMALNEDPVAEVRKAARLALDWLSNDGMPGQRYVIRRPGEGPASWTVGAQADESDAVPVEDWRAALLGLIPDAPDEDS